MTKAVETETAFQTWEGAIEIPLDQLVPTRWNVNEMGDVEFAELIAEIEDGEFDEPCQVVQIPDGENEGKYLLIGGEHRYKAASALGMESVPCVIKKHLDPSDEAELMAWSVRRNNIRGRINAQRYAEIEKAIAERKKVGVKVARERMLVRGEQLKRLRKTGAIQENEDEPAAAPKGKSKAESSKAPETDGEKDAAKDQRSKRRLLADLKAIEADVLLESEDTVEHGYLWFGQNGKQHLVVEESPKLYALIERAVNACKRDSAKIDELFVSALTRELKEWE